jgi:hypothetical protein
MVERAGDAINTLSKLQRSSCARYRYRVKPLKRLVHCPVVDVSVLRKGTVAFSSAGAASKSPKRDETLARMLGAAEAVAAVVAPAGGGEFEDDDRGDDQQEEFHGDLPRVSGDDQARLGTNTWVEAAGQRA